MIWVNGGWPRRVTRPGQDDGARADQNRCCPGNFEQVDRRSAVRPGAVVQRVGVVLTVPSAVPMRGPGMVIELDSAIKRAVQVAALAGQPSR